MSQRANSHDFIINKINALRNVYPSLRSKTDDYVFSVLCVKAVFYKNPACILDESDIFEIVVDGQYDGGVDILLSDPDSEGADLVIGQSKHWGSITADNIRDAVIKMAIFYKDMINGNYEKVNETVQGRFLSLNSQIGEESKIHFVFFTSAPQKRIQTASIIRKFKEQFDNADNIDIEIYYDKEIQEAIIESESRQPTVEKGIIMIDQKDNILWHGEDAIVNASAYSIKGLYGLYNKNLLSRNLRYHVKGPDIDKGIADTINNDPDSFWVKNNGLTIICDSFKPSGKEIKLNYFSIINGGQTTYAIHKNGNINKTHDFYLPCKIVTAVGTTSKEKNAYILDIAKAANTQKPIKKSDLKANSPGQLSFAQAMRDVGVFYKTKNGDEIPALYRLAYKNSDIVEIGKLCLSGIFQMPGTRRNRPATFYDSKYYDIIFNNNQIDIAKLCKELLYIDYYFVKVFQKEFDHKYKNTPTATVYLELAHNARNICGAYAALAGRYRQGLLTDDHMKQLFDSIERGNEDEIAYQVFHNVNGLRYIFEKELFEDLDRYDLILNHLFSAIIRYLDRLSWLFLSWPLIGHAVSEANQQKHPLVDALRGYGERNPHQVRQSSKLRKQFV